MPIPAGTGLCKRFGNVSGYISNKLVTGKNETCKKRISRPTQDIAIKIPVSFEITATITD